ncbi:MAG: hypothetical protein J6J43_03065 [Oscillospiraceae bacterium]|nr:hypothetical protein [Oscillospiraceae bacterium]
MKKRLMSILLLLAVLISVTPGNITASSLCFVGVNDSVPMYLSASEAPYYKGAALYVPYTVFQASPAGIAVSYNADKGSLALFTRAKRLVYDLNAGTITDENQRVNSVEIVFRNGIPYIPVTRAVSHFGLTASMLTSASGCPVLRFTDGSQQLGNDVFIRKAETLISIILEQEQETQAPNAPQDGANEKEETPENTGPATVYLAFAGSAVSEQTLETLKTMKVYAAFFLSQKQIMEEKELVREIYAQGHQIGLTVEEGETEYLTALQAANDALDKVLFCKSLMALLPGNAPDIARYSVFKEWSGRNSVDEVLQNLDAAQLLVCRSDSTFVLQRLLEEGAYTPQLLETTRIPGVSTR